MIKNYLKIAWRNLLKERQFTMLNLIGLSTGLACTLLIYLWVNDELHVDRYNEKDDRLYQVMANHKSEDGIKTIHHTAGPLATSLATEFPEVENAVTVLPASWFSDKGTATFKDMHLKAGGQFVGKDYFNVFTCPVIDGDPQSLFRDNQTIGISNALALKLFHTADNIIGKSIQWEHGEFGGIYNIGLVFKENPANATEHFDLLFNFDLYVAKRESMKSWSNSDPSTYVILKQGADNEQFNAKIKKFLATKDKSIDITLLAVKFSDKYLHGHFENGVQAGGRITYVRLFSIIALFILVIACINFMNLSTAKASGRMKEVGIKKAIGTMRRSLAGAETQTIARINQTFTDFYKGNVFEYQFLDENYNALYASEQRIGILSQYFAGLAILISCLGLFGLAAFTAQRRQKEIGIRKVVGATVQDVTMLLSVDFLKLVVIAMIIAFPLIGWAMNRWLQEFAYHAEIGFNVFLISAASICVLALITVGYQAIKAALMDPVKSLKSE
ncbi:FtsX-like permease family protein [Dyadobacter fanqingshengii]|uniref:ABC transporter permease n=1 Tax=Dyadobacter fanqingshengii TaxID=2906443 RepID=A0A9X1P7A0_9BACT|nr:FtsX-like permease family protein [Dyadobacter fanqingshengii]MCF0039355.1 ABC transporter permease [Dyadobacter fanqingshengii]USJ33830.1 ABC transporter permease [Dyadobacter fanqingshengii]